MRPSAEATGAQRQFAADVLRNLLRHIVQQNAEGRYTFLVSHAWTKGSMMYLTYKAPPSDIVWGFVRDTRVSLIDPGPWPDVDEAVLYYYILDLEGIQPSGAGSTRHPGDPSTILWLGNTCDDLPAHPSDLPDAYRYSPPNDTPPPRTDRDQGPQVINEPRRYADPF